MVSPSKVCSVKSGALKPWRGAGGRAERALPGGALLAHIQPAPASRIKIENIFQFLEVMAFLRLAYQNLYNY